jgi:predicted CoA-substrate-specific enzyme activase
MTVTAGIDVGSTYTKAVLVDEGGSILGRSMEATGFKLDEVSARCYREALRQARLADREVAYVATTGYGRFQVPFRDVQITDLTAHARGARHFFPGTMTVLDVGGQTMKTSRLDAPGKVAAFRLNDKCAAGTGAFIEKAARYLGFSTEEIGPLAATAKTPVPISGVCAVFAESEVINHVSTGSAPSDIMQGAILSLVERCVQLMRRVQAEPEFTLVGGILRFESMAELLRSRIGAPVNLPPAGLVQYVGALGAAVLAERRLRDRPSPAAVALADAEIV